MKGAHEAELGSPRGEAELDDHRGETRLWASPSSRRPLLSNTLSCARQHYPWLARRRPLARPRHNPTFARPHTPTRHGGSWGATKSGRWLPQESPVERPTARSLEAWRGGRARRPTYGKDCDGRVPVGLEALVRPAGGVGGGRSSGGEAGRHGRERHARAGAAWLRRRGGRRGSDDVRRRRGRDGGCVAGLVGLCGAIEEERTKQMTY
jgi:hypothetical protein